MNYLEIIFRNVKKVYLDRIVGGCIRFDMSDLISSHFFDQKNQKDIEYTDIKNLETYFSNTGIGNLYLKKIQIGMELRDVVILVNCDKEYGDITLSFLEEQFHHMEKQELKRSFRKLIQAIIGLCECCEISDSILGYEPAEDEDMKFMEIKQGQVMNFNEKVHQSKTIQAFHQIGKEYY